MSYVSRCLLVCAALFVCGTLHAQTRGAGSAQDYPARRGARARAVSAAALPMSSRASQRLNSARALARRSSSINRPGANSILAWTCLSKSTPDGYTLGTVIAAHAANQTLYAKLPYDSIKSFEHVSLLRPAPLILCATNSLPVSTAKDLVELAKANAGQLTFASSASAPPRT